MRSRPLRSLLIRVKKLVGLELGAQPARLNPDNGVGLGIEAVAAIEHVHAQRVLFELAAFSFESSRDDVRQKTAEAGRAREGLTSEDPRQVGSDLDFRRRE